MACPCTPTIKRDDQLINASTKKRYALPGQIIHLKIDGCTGIEESSVEWTIPGTIFDEWVVDPFPDLQWAELHPAVTNGHSQIQYSWADAPGLITIKATFTVAGEQCQAEAEMEIISPSVSVLDIGLGKVQCFFRGTGQNAQPRVGLVTYGPNHYGLYLKYRVDVPLDPTFGFSTGWTFFCQILDHAKDRFRSWGGQCIYVEQEDCTCLDSFGQEYAGGPITTFATNSEDSIFIDRYPSMALDQQFEEIYGTRPGLNYLMFHPGDYYAQWVPLRLVTWNASWCSRSCNISGWQLLSKSSSIIGPSSTANHPVWSCSWHDYQTAFNRCPACGPCGSGSFGCLHNATHLP
jgi:hypothetical protein